MLSEVSQTQKDKPCVTHSHEVPGGVRFRRQDSRRWCQGWGRGREGVFPGDTVSAWEDRKFWRWAVVMGDGGGCTIV